MKVKGQQAITIANNARTSLISCIFSKKKTQAQEALNSYKQYAIEAGIYDEQDFECLEKQIAAMR